MYARMCVAGALLGVALPAGAQVLADSRAEFSGVQGEAGWHYGYYSGDMTSASFQEMSVFQNGRRYAEPGHFWTFVGADVAHPNGTITSPPSEPANQWAARRWVADYSGAIHIDTSLRKVNV